jgi:hypothetical protein
MGTGSGLTDETEETGADEVLEDMESLILAVGSELLPICRFTRVIVGVE